MRRRKVMAMTAFALVVAAVLAMGPVRQEGSLWTCGTIREHEVWTGIRTSVFTKYGLYVDRTQFRIVNGQVVERRSVGPWFTEDEILHSAEGIQE